jgi:hypothetical protein
VNDGSTIIVTGDRYWTDYAFILAVLADWHSGMHIRLLVHGACRGVDSLCDRAAEVLGIRVESNPAEWERLGLSAGPQRNRLMLHKHPECRVVLAFHNRIADSKGTRDMIKVSVNTGREVILYSHSGVTFL